MDETKTTETTTEQPKKEEDTKPKTWREEPGAKAVFKQLDDMKAKLASYESQHAEAEAAAERKRLEETGQWKEKASALDNEIKALQANHAAQLRSLTLEAKLASITDPYARAGAIARAPVDMEVDAYVVKLREDAPHLFAAPQPPGVGAGVAPPQGAAGGAAAEAYTRSQLDAMMASGKKDLVLKATDYNRKYFLAHGVFPQ